MPGKLVPEGFHVHGRIGLAGLPEERDHSPKTRTLPGRASARLSTGLIVRQNAAGSGQPSTMKLASASLASSDDE